MKKHKDVREFLTLAAERHKTKTAFSVFLKDRWQTITFQELASECERVAREMAIAGLRPGEKVLLISESSLDWAIYFFGILLNGAVAVPLDVKLSEGELRSIARHAQPQMILTSELYREAGRTIRRGLDGVPKVLVIDNPAESYVPVVEEPSKVELTRDSLAAICYTSGTVGNPKGVRIKTETLLFEAEAIAEIDNRILEETVMFSMVPLNHLLGLTGGMIYTVISGYEMCFAHALEPEAIMKCLMERKATQLLTVPLFLKMVKQGIERRVREAGKEKSFRLLLKVCMYLPLGKILFKQVHARLGGRLRRFVVGGSSLDPEIYDFFLAIGIPIFEGYGLTETGPVITVNSDHGSRRGSVGKALPGVEVKIEIENHQDGTGEILTRGPHVMEGYHLDKSLTNEVLTEDGWFRTGDLGRMDKGGYLYITGRKKSLIVLSSGKKVHPEEVEACISQSQRIKTACVLGLTSKDNTLIGEMVVAVVLPTEEELKNFNGSFEELEKSLKAEVQALCKNLVDFKRPTRIIVRDKPFVMTITQKVKRNALLAELT